MQCDDCLRVDDEAEMVAHPLDGVYRALCPPCYAMAVDDAELDAQYMRERETDVEQLEWETGAEPER